MRKVAMIVVALAAPLVLLAQVPGGVPSFLRVQALGVGANPVASQINLAGATPRVVVNASSGTEADFRLVGSGTTRGIFCLEVTAGTCIVGSGANDISLRTEGGALRISTNSGASTAVSVSSAGVLNTTTANSITMNGALVSTAKLYAFSFLPSATPSVSRASLTAGSWTVARNGGTGLYRITTTGTVWSGNQIGSCTVRGSTPVVGFVIMVSFPGATWDVNTYNTSAVLTDLQAVDCVAVDN